MKRALRVALIVMRLALGGLFVYGGVQKFIPKERPQSGSTIELPDHVIKIKSFIGGMKQTGYFWEFLGVAEILGGALLLSQVLSLLGAFILFPIVLNIFLFHAFLEPHDTGELFMTGLYLIANLVIIFYHFPDLKQTFLKFKLT